jgi:hypothetical protein
MARDDLSGHECALWCRQWHICRLLVEVAWHHRRELADRILALRRNHPTRSRPVTTAETAPAGRPRPDMVKISSFPDEAAKAAFEAHPAHRDA